MAHADEVFKAMCRDILDNGTDTKGEKVRPHWSDGTPAYTHIVCPLSSSDAVEHLMKTMGDNITLWVAAIDEELTSRSYIVPGLGDAGDLAYGDKV